MSIKKTKVIACVKCENCERSEKRIKCKLGYFDENKIIVLYTPYDFECKFYKEKDVYTKHKENFIGE